MKRNTQIRIHRKKRKPEPLRAYAKTKQRERTAYHEAGHAVAALVQNLWFRSVTIKRDEEYLGAIFHPNILGYEHSGKRERRSIARACIIVLYAGWEAEELFDPNAEEWRSDSDKKGAFDISRQYSVVSRRVSFIGDDAHRAFLRRLQAEARALIRAHWQTVKAIASALLKDRTLNDEQANKIAATVRASNTRKDGNS